MNDKKVLLDYGNGGKKSYDMISKIILPAFDNEYLNKLDDFALFNLDSKRVSFSTDSYVIDPIFFPGGDIGELAVNGTVNDISMSGATPLFISAAFMIEEGFLFKDLKTIVNSMAKASKKANVKIVTGDTKIVSKGSVDKIFINTSGVGVVEEGINISGNNVKVGDKIILSGTMADHGIAILLKRENLNFTSTIVTDSAPLNGMIKNIISSKADVHCFRDPTRGGVGTTLNEIALQSNVGMEIYEDKLPIKEEVKGACELLGFDPLYIANEGKLLVFVAPEDADKALSVIKKNKFGKDASIIGTVTDSKKVYLKTLIGGRRIIDMMSGTQLPRIC